LRPLAGTLVVLDKEGRPRFNWLMFHRRPRVYVAFNVLVAEGKDLRELALRGRKSVLKRLLGPRHDLIVVDGMAGEGRRLFQLVCEQDLEGIVAKRLADPYGPDTRWREWSCKRLSARPGSIFGERKCRRRFVR
jgi:bifunctional non-homologous end joining protein LigD